MYVITDIDDNTLDGENLFNYATYVLNDDVSDAELFAKVYPWNGEAFNGAESVIEALTSALKKVTTTLSSVRPLRGTEAFGVDAPGLGLSDGSIKEDIEKAIREHFNKPGEDGKTIFRVQEVIIQGNTVIVIGYESRVKEMIATPR